MDFLRDFDDFFSWGFGKPTKLRFNTGKTYDVNPVYWEEIIEGEEKKGYKSVCRTVGIDPEDVKVSLERNYIKVEGKTEYEGKTYSTYFEIPVSESVMADIENIKYITKNGLTYVYLYIKKPEFKKITIEKL